MPPADEEDYWSELLPLIDDGLVVPVLGSQVLRVGDELLYPRLARELAQELKIGAPEPATLNEVACRYLEEKRTRSLSAVHATLRKLIEARSYAVPEPLRKLAEITPFNVFLTTSFETSLETAIDDVRYGGRAATRAIPYSINAGGDLPDELKDEGAVLRSPVVFHLFGLPAPFNQYAVTDEEVLEYVHSLQSGEKRPETLFNFVANKHLLILGSNFTDWLARFFIRSTKRERLWKAKQREDFLVDEALAGDRSFSGFLQHFGGDMRVFTMQPVAFVDELHRRWTEAHPQDAMATPAAEERDPATVAPMRSGSIFISYAHEDAHVANAVASQLAAAKLDVWLDKETLRAGELYDRVIKKNIKDATLFIALVSRTATLSRERYFRREWNHALDSAQGRPLSPPYILAFSVDGTPVPVEFENRHFETLANGRLSDKQIASIVDFFVQHEALREQVG